jgi:hydrogenase nickel incorporation protein HypA/HybF
MHEMALVESVIDMVAEHAQGHRVCRVKLEIGKLTCVTPDAIRFCFDVATEKTPLEDAALEIVEIEARARCRACGETFAQGWLSTACPCGAHDYERLSGEELRVKEYELAADAGVAAP